MDFQPSLSETMLILSRGGLGRLCRQFSGLCHVGLSSVFASDSMIYWAYKKHSIHPLLQHKDHPYLELPLCGHVVSRSFQCYLYRSTWLPSRSKQIFFVSNLQGWQDPIVEGINDGILLELPIFSTKYYNNLDNTTSQCGTFDTGTDDAIVQDGISLNRPFFFHRPKSSPGNWVPKRTGF